MIVDREKMLEVLNQACDLTIRNCYSAFPRPLAPAGTPCNITSQIQRFIMPLTKSKRIRYASGGLVVEREFYPGDVLFCHPYAWTTELWDTDHTMLSVVFRERTVRTLFIDHDGIAPPPPTPDVIFHTSASLNICGAHLLKSIATSGKLNRTACYALQALLEVVRDTLKNDDDLSLSKEAFTWDCLQDYMESNAFRVVSREDAAAALRLHPAHISRLVKKRAGYGFNEYLTKLRMERAASLLEDQTLTVDEIAGMCGYNYTSYFIRVFRSFFVDSPAHYREKLRSKMPEGKNHPDVKKVL